MIRLDHVYKGFNGNAVLEDISLALPEKGFCAITGRSGRGKTTLLYLIAGLYKPDRGSIQRNGETISMVFQEDRLLPWETAAQNAAIASTREIAAKLLTELGLGAELDKYPRELSGGMQRRVSIARALAAKADVYIMDEPGGDFRSGVGNKFVVHIRLVKIRNPDRKYSDSIPLGLPDHFPDMHPRIGLTGSCCRCAVGNHKQ